MVDCEYIKLENNKNYKIEKCEGYAGCAKHFKQASDNSKKFLLEGRPVTIVSPKRHLSAEEKEEFRKFFCKKAQEDRMNYIYFEDSVIVSEYDPMEGTMFEDL